MNPKKTVVVPRPLSTVFRMPGRYRLSVRFIRVEAYFPPTSKKAN